MQILQGQSQRKSTKQQQYTSSTNSLYHESER